MEELGSKQKRFLRSKAHHLTPIFQIGKNGVNDELMIQIGEALEKRELIKVSLLQTCTETPEEAAEEIQVKVRCHVVQVIGRVIVLYRQSRNEKYQRVSEEVRLLTNKKRR